MQFNQTTLSQTDMEAFLLANCASANLELSKLFDPKLVHCSFEKKELTLSFKVKDWQLNPGGELHGGMIITGFNTAFSLLANYFKNPDLLNTVNQNTVFLKPVLPTDTIEYHVRISSIGNNLIGMLGKAHIQRDNILAGTASATFVVADK